MLGKSWLHPLGMGILLMLIVFSITSCASSKPIPPIDETATASKLELQRWKWYKSSNWFFVAEGQVKNISSENLDEITAIATFYDKNGKLLKNERKKIKCEQLAPGKVSQFRVVASFHPKATQARVDFKDFMGEFIPVDRKEKAAVMPITE